MIESNNISGDKKDTNMVTNDDKYNNNKSYTWVKNKLTIMFHVLLLILYTTLYISLLMIPVILTGVYNNPQWLFMFLLTLPLAVALFEEFSTIMQKTAKVIDNLIS
jgi:hypothetical protein